MAKQQQNKIETAIAVLNQQLGSGAASKYNAAKAIDTLKWTTEKVFIQQIFQRNEFLCSVLLTNPGTLLSSLQTAASLGLTLDPSQGLAFLVPQRPKFDLPYEIILKVSYKGMEQAVQRSGTVSAITTELVHENDEFDYGVGIDGPYLHFKMSRGDRGEVQGGFCLARYANGERHVEWMPVVDMVAIEAAAHKAAGDKGSQAWRGPFKPEMRKKSIVRRGFKHWPASPIINQLAQSFDRESPVDLSHPELEGEAVEVFGDTEVNALMKRLSAIPPDQAAKWLQMKAQSEGFEDIRSVPRDRFDAFREQLVHRMELVLSKKQAVVEEPSDADPSTP